MPSSKLVGQLDSWQFGSLAVEQLDSLAVEQFRSWLRHFPSPSPRGVSFATQWGEKGKDSHREIYIISWGKGEGEFPSPRGIEVKEYVERRLAENGNQMIIETRKMGKWRRWLAKAHLPDTGRTLNEELIERGLARRAEE